MPLAAVLLVLTSSFFHVAWNSLVKTSGDPLATATRAVCLGILVVTPAAIVAWLATGQPSLAPEGWVIALVSGIVSAAYFVPLSAAYRRGALSSVYPVARGSGALLGVIVGVTILGEQLAPAGLVGVALLLGGTLAAASTTASRATVAPALLAGCAVATYSALDRVGVRTGPAWLYAWVLWSVCALGLIAWGLLVSWVRARGANHEPGTAGGHGPGAAASSGSAAGKRRVGRRGRCAHLRGDAPRRSSPRPADRWRPGSSSSGHTCSSCWPSRSRPLAGVAPLREATTILAAAWGVVVLKERDHAGTRLAAAGAVAVGAILLATSG